MGNKTLCCCKNTNNSEMNFQNPMENENNNDNNEIDKEALSILIGSKQSSSIKLINKNKIYKDESDSNLYNFNYNSSLNKNYESTATNLDNKCKTIIAKIPTAKFNDKEKRTNSIVNNNANNNNKNNNDYLKMYYSNNYSKNSASVKNKNTIISNKSKQTNNDENASNNTVHRQSLNSIIINNYNNSNIKEPKSDDLMATDFMESPLKSNNRNQLSNNLANTPIKVKNILKRASSRRSRKSRISITSNYSKEKKPSKFVGNNNTDNTVNTLNNIINTNNNNCASEIKLEDNDFSYLTNILKNNFLFKDFTTELFESLKANVSLFKYEKESIIFNQGEEGSNFYIIKSGKIEYFVDGKLKDTYGINSFLGEASLLLSSCREGTAKCLTNIEVFVLNGSKFRQSQAMHNKVILSDRFYFLNLIPVLKSLSNVQLNNLTSVLNEQKIKAKITIFEEGQEGNSLYIFKQGSVSCITKEGKEVRRMLAKDFFGEASLLFNANRSLKVATVEDCVLYEITSQNLKEALGNNYIDIILFSIFKEFVSKNETMTSLFVDSQLLELYKLFKLRKYSKHQTIISSKKKENNKLIVIIQGGVVNSITKKIIASRGELYGENLLKTQFCQSYSLIAEPDCMVLEASWDTITENKNGTTISTNKKINKLKSIPFFKDFSLSKLTLLAKMLKTEKYKSGDIIIKQSTTFQNFIYIRKGVVGVYKDKYIIKIIKEGDIYGEEEILNNEKSMFTLIASPDTKDPVVLYTITKKEFFSLSNEVVIQKMIEKNHFNNTKISLNDLYFINVIGKGKFGTVALVHNTKTYFALKMLNRQVVEKHKYLSNYYVSEKRILSNIDNNFIVKLVKTFKDQKYCYLLMEYVHGVSFEEYLFNRSTCCDINEFLFYTGLLIFIVGYLNSQHIVHRDIKPTNIIIDNYGYLKLVDFGTAKIIQDYTTSIVGTPGYMAPEIILGKGYGLSPDFWSVGVCAYEIFYNSLPFGDDSVDIMDVYKSVLYDDLKFPSSDESHKIVQEFISGLINKKVNLRLCDVEKIKEKEIFDDFSWDKLLDYNIVPPFIPVLDSLEVGLSDTSIKLISVMNEIEEVDLMHDNSFSDEDNSIEDYDAEWADQF